MRNSSENIVSGLVITLLALALVPAFSSALPDSSTKVQGQNCEMTHPFSYRYSFQYDRVLEVGKSYELSVEFWISNSIVTTNPYSVDVSLSADGFELSERQFSLTSGSRAITITPTKEGGKISVTARLMLDGNDRRHPGYQAMYFDNFELSDFSLVGSAGEGSTGAQANSSAPRESRIKVSDDKTLNQTTTTEGDKTTTEVEVERKAPSPAPWYIVRITGMIAYALLAASIIMGLLRKLNPKKYGRLCSLHCDISYLALIFAFLHGINNIVDKYMWRLGAGDVFWLSFASQNHTFISLGVIAMYVLLMVIVSSVSPKVISFIKRRSWYLVHLSSYAAFMLVALHSIMLGTDLQFSDLSNPLTLISSIIFWGLLALTVVLFFAALLIRKPKKAGSSGPDGKAEQENRGPDEDKGDVCEVEK